MKRVILSIPTGTTLDTLTIEQRLAIESVFGQFAMPMPGTVEYMGRVLCDATIWDNFDPAVMPGLGFDWSVVGLWQWDGVAPAVTALADFDSTTFYNHLPPRQELDAEGNVTATMPPELHEPHRWAGWPGAF